VPIPEGFGRPTRFRQATSPRPLDQRRIEATIEIGFVDRAELELHVIARGPQLRGECFAQRQFEIFIKIGLEQAMRLIEKCTELREPVAAGSQQVLVKDSHRLAKELAARYACVMLNLLAQEVGPRREGNSLANFPKYLMRCRAGRRREEAKATG
jgi:hypothetical protein